MKRAFGLVELVVVVAVVAIVIAICSAAIAKSKAVHGNDETLENPTPRLSIVEYRSVWQQSSFNAYIISDSVTSNDFLVVVHSHGIAMNNLEHSK